MPELTRTDKARLTAGRDMWSTCPVPQFGAISVRMADGPMGVAGGRIDERDIALLTPCGLSLGASFDHALVRRVGEVVGEDANRLGIQALLAPNLNLMRSPLAGRAFEYFGEDPQLVAELGWAWVAGVQARGVAAVVKHVVCNDSETQRKHMNAVVDEATLRDVYLRPFEYAARQGAWAMMAAYNRVNGVRCAENRLILRDWLKRELHWDGLMVSDWFGTHDGSASLRAGLDLEMPGPARKMGEVLAQTADTALLDEANERLLRLARRVASAPAFDASETANARRVDVLEDAAAAGMVLLRNQGSRLPLSPRSSGCLAVIGPNAQTPCFQGGTFAKVALTPQILTPIEALRERFGRDGWAVEFAPGVAPEYRIPPLTDMSPMTGADVPGLEVVFESASGTYVHEHRHASSLFWFKQMPALGDLLEKGVSGRIRVSTRLRAPRTGRHRFYVGGTGPLALHLDGQAHASFPGVALGADIMGTLMQTPHVTVDVALTAGQEVALELVMQVGPNLAHGLWLGCQVPPSPDLLGAAMALAKRADEVILIAGETSDAGLESVDRRSTFLPPAQQALIEQVCQFNPHTTVVLNVAHPVDMHCLREAAAVLLVWYPGQQFGPALAAVLAGDREPGGRLPVTLAEREAEYLVLTLAPDGNGDLLYHEHWWVGYRHFLAHGKHPAYAFGHGLGYARFVWSKVTLELADDGKALSLSINVHNVSARTGKEVVQVYLAEPELSGQPRRISLHAFAAVHVVAGACAQVQLELPSRQFAHWRKDQGAWRFVAGRYELWLGRASDDIRHRHGFDLDAQGMLKIAAPAATIPSAGDAS